MNNKEGNSLIDFDSFDPFAPTTTDNNISHQTSLVSSIEVDGNAFNDFSDAFNGDDWQTAMQNVGVLDDPSNSFGHGRGGFDQMDWGLENVASVTVDVSSNDVRGDQNHFQHFEVNRDVAQDKPGANTRASKIIETETKAKDPVIAKDDQFMDLEFVESRPRSEKGLAGLKMFDHKIEEEFSSKTSSSRQPQKDSTAAEKASSMVFNYGSALENSCKQCNKRVYEMEKITVDMVIYHKSCFRCVTCGKILSPSTYSATGGQIYCKVDFMKNFKMKGSYVFSPEPTLPSNDDDITASIDEDGTPIVPIKYMKDLFERSDGARDEMMMIQERSDQVDGSNKSDVVVSSNVCVIEDELPPPSLAQNMRAMFENKESSSAKMNNTNKAKKVDEKRNTVQTNEKKPKVETEVGSFSTFSGVEEEGEDEIPQSGMTRNLLVRWRGIEDTSHVGSRGREEKRSSGAMHRSQSSSRVEISQRLRVVSDDRPPPTNRTVSKEEGHHAVESPKPQSTPAPSKTFKWQVKEATPLNRPCIVHGDLPKYQATVGDIINEKTPISEINREQYVPVISNIPQAVDEYEDMNGEAIARGSYVTEIREEELPDSAAVKSAMLRFRAMEDPTKTPPVPGKVAPNPSNRLSYQAPIASTQNQGASIDNDDEVQEELPASGTTKNLLAKFQSFQSK